MASRRGKSVLDYDYKVDENMSIARRLAMFMAWAGNEMPGRAIPYQHIAKVVLIRQRVSADGVEVQQIKSARTRARKILLTEFKLALITVEGMGMRVSTSADDLVENQVERDARRVVQATEALDRSSAAVKVSEISSTDLKRRFNTITRATRVLASHDVLEKLRLPAASKEK